MNERLFDDVKRLLKNLEGMNYHDAKILLQTALEVIDQHSYLDLSLFEIQPKEEK